MLKPNVEMETSATQANGFNGNDTILEEIAWIISKKERPPKSSHYPLPPRK